MDAPSQTAELEKALFDAFDPYVARDHNSIRPALIAAFEAAPIEMEGRPGVTWQRFSDDPMIGKIRMPVVEDAPKLIVIDKTALVKGIVKAGRTPSTQPSSARWLVEWLQNHGAEPDEIAATDGQIAESNHRAFTSGMPIIASRSLRERILPRASELAKHTVGRNQADMRHLLFALLEEEPTTLHPLGESLDVARLQQLKSWLAKRITATPEPKENVKAWRELARKPPAAEGVGTLSDAPALVDLLGRQAFAVVLASRITQVSESLRSGKLGDDSAFIFHVDGPWGSGKSSILNFLKKNLKSSEPPWLIVEFNAWQNQHRKPAWWPLISHVGTAVSQLSWFRFPAARRVWVVWNLRMRWIPIVLACALTSVLAFLAFNIVSDEDNPAKNLQAMGQAVIALATFAGLAWTASRTLTFGSKNAAEVYVQSNAEPFRPIIELFKDLVAATGRPVSIFIDDLDRCDSTYVIELLEGIQTLLRSAPVVYVVAGDRKWICSSFEKRYSDFCGEIGVPGRPLGYLFLDKVFQLSTAIPRLSAVRQAEYWNRLLESGQGARPEKEELQRLEQEAEHSLQGKTRHEDIQREIDRTKNPVERETMRAAAAKQITSPEAMKATEHRLQHLAPLLEANPRSMKRLVNTYGLNHARAFLEGRKVAVEVLARWTIVELRWPVLANYFSTHWTDIAGGRLSPTRYPDEIRMLLAESDVRDVFGREGEKVRLTKDALAPILE